MRVRAAADGATVVLMDGKPASGVEVTVAAANQRFDAVTLEIFWRRMISAVDEAAKALRRTSFSTLVNESNDFALVLTDAAGQSLAQNTESNLNNNVGMFRSQGLGAKILLGTDGMHQYMVNPTNARDALTIAHAARELVEAGHEFYTEPGAFALRDTLGGFEGGHVVASALAPVIGPLATRAGSALRSLARVVMAALRRSWGLVHGLAGRDEAELDVAVRAPLVLAVQHAARIEVLDLGGDARGQPRRIERADGSDAGSAGDEALPARGHVVAEGRQHAHPGHDHATPGHPTDLLSPLAPARTPPAALRPRCWSPPPRPCLLLVGVDVVDGVLDALDVLGLLVGDLDLELLFEGHDELDRVERVGPEVVDE